MDNSKEVKVLMRSLIIAILAFIRGGIDPVKNFFSAIWVGIEAICAWLGEIFIGFLPYWGIEDWSKCVAVFFGILFLASITGTYFSIKKKKKLWKNICIIFDIISFIATAISAVNLI